MVPKLGRDKTQSRGEKDGQGMKQDKLIHQEDRTLQIYYGESPLPQMPSILLHFTYFPWIPFIIILLVFFLSLLGGWQGMTSLCWKYTEQHEYLIKIVLHST